MVVPRFAKGQGHLLREEILVVTAQMMEQVTNADEISIRAVAKAVGRTSPQIYEHFTDRDHLLNEAAKTALANMASCVEHVVSAPPGQTPTRRTRTAKITATGSPEPAYRQRLRARAHAYVNFAVASPVAYRVLFMEPRAQQMSVHELLRIGGMDAVIRDLSEARSDGRLAWPDVEYVAMTLWVLLHGVASVRLTHPSATWPSDLLDRLLDEMTLGLLPRG